MKPTYALILYTIGILPIEKIEKYTNRIEDVRYIYVTSYLGGENRKQLYDGLQECFKKHSTVKLWEDWQNPNTIMCIELKRGSTYQEIRDLLFDLAKRKEVLKLGLFGES